MKCTPTVVIHGGAWAIPDDVSEESRLGVCEAARAGYKTLQDGGSAVDAVEAAVRVLEDIPIFDAGISFKPIIVALCVSGLLENHTQNIT